MPWLWGRAPAAARWNDALLLKECTDAPLPMDGVDGDGALEECETNCRCPVDENGMEI